MSVISNRHTVVPFVAGKTVPFEGQRLAKIGYKSTKNAKARFASVAVSVPAVGDSVLANLTQEQQTNLLQALQSAIETAQDGIIRSLYESADGTLKEVADDEIGVSAIIGYLTAENAGNRLTKDGIIAWFDENVGDSLGVMIASKLGVEDITPAVEKHVDAYRQLFGSLAGGKTMLQASQIGSVRKALEIAAVEDAMHDRLVKRLVSMEAPKNIEELLEL